jgi:hypothetical protein
MCKSPACNNLENGLDAFEWMHVVKPLEPPVVCKQIPESPAFIVPGRKSSVVQRQIPRPHHIPQDRRLTYSEPPHPVHTAHMQPAKPQPRTLTLCKHTIYFGEIASGLMTLPLMFAREASFAEDVLMLLVLSMLNSR